MALRPEGMGLGLCLRWAGVFKRNLLSREGQVGGALRAQRLPLSGALLSEFFSGQRPVQFVFRLNLRSCPLAPAAAKASLAYLHCAQGQSPAVPPLPPGEAPATVERGKAGGGGRWRPQHTVSLCPSIRPCRPRGPLWQVKKLPTATANPDDTRPTLGHLHAE